jgi:hypothetical protein
MSWTRKELGISGAITLVLLFVALVALEIALPILRPGPNQRDELLGWRLRSNFHRTYQKATFGGSPYPVRIDTNADGFRVFGTNEKAPVRILVLGDSVTVDPNASDDRMWYARMTQRLAERTGRPLRDFYVLAGGGGGWSTYQNLLLSERLSRKIKPDLFVLEFSSNNFRNNVYGWERESVVRAQFMRRPFASLDGKGPKYESGLVAKFYRSILGESRIFGRIDGVIGTLQTRWRGGKTTPPETQKRYERESIALTKMLLTRLRNQYRDIPAIMVNADESDFGANREWKTLARETGFIPLPGPSQFISSLTQDQRKALISMDGMHPSDEGNQRYGIIAGDQLADLVLSVLRKR